jgi:MFS family permease
MPTDALPFLDKVMANILVIASLIFSKKRAGGSWAFLAMIRFASIFLAANLAGIINQKYGFPQSFLLSGIIMIFAGLIVILWLRPRFQEQMKTVDKFIS